MSFRKSWSASVDASSARARGDGLLVDFRRDDLDLLLLERLVEVVELAGLEVELVEGEGDLLGGQRPTLARRLEEPSRLIGVEDIVNPLPLYLNPSHKFSPCPRLPRAIAVLV